MGAAVKGSCAQIYVCGTAKVQDGGEGEEGGEGGSASRDAQLALEMWCGGGLPLLQCGGTAKGQVSFGRVTLGCAGEGRWLSPSLPGSPQQFPLERGLV